MHGVDYDPVYLIAKKTLDNGISDPLKFMQEFVACLYRIGVIGIKLNTESNFIYSHLDQVLINKNEILFDTKIRIHQMLHAAFHLNEDKKI